MKKKIQNLIWIYELYMFKSNPAAFTQEIRKKKYHAQ